MLATHVLVIDDCAINREVVHEILGDDYTIVDAGNAQEALLRARELAPQVVLLDIMLPDANGYEVCQQLRNLPTMAAARIIMVSAKAMQQEQDAGLRAGADAYLTKPFNEDDLRALLQGVPAS